MIYPAFSYALLKYNKAWEKDLKIVEKNFDKTYTIPLTEENITTLLNGGFDFMWCAAFLLDDKDWKEFYLFTLPHWQEFNITRDNAWDAYKRKRTKDTEKECMDEYLLIKSLAMLKYKGVVAHSFSEIFTRK